MIAGQETWQVATAITAIYGAIVATGALFLEARRWFEDGPRLSIRVVSAQRLINMPGYEQKTLLVVTVSNRGTRSTTITNLGLMEFTSLWRQFRRRPKRSGIVVVSEIPGTGMRIPYIIEPGREWLGMVVHDQELKEWMDTGKLFVAVFASHHDRAFVKRVKPPRRDQSPLTTNISSAAP